MKKTGFAVLIVGLLMIAYTGFTYITKEKVVDLGSVQITRDEGHEVNWPPYVGVAVTVVGAVLLMSGKKKLLLH